jgi:hypothetical protein
MDSPRTTENKVYLWDHLREKEDRNQTVVTSEVHNIPQVVHVAASGLPFACEELQ